MIPVEVSSAPWRYTTLLKMLDHWQSLAAGLIALLAAIIAVGGPEFFARLKERREIKALRAALAGEIRLYVDLLISTRHLLKVRDETFYAGPTGRDRRFWPWSPKVAATA